MCLDFSNFPLANQAALPVNPRHRANTSFPAKRKLFKRRRRVLHAMSLGHGLVGHLAAHHVQAA